MKVLDLSQFCEQIFQQLIKYANMSPPNDKVESNDENNIIKPVVVDIWRDSPLRYMGYANEVGEALFRHMYPKFVRPSYAVACVSICRLVMTQSSIKQSQRIGKMRAMTVTTWQMLPKKSDWMHLFGKRFLLLFSSPARSSTLSHHVGI